MIQAFLVLALAVQEPQAPAEGQKEESTLQIYDLRPLMPRFDSDGTWQQSLLVPSADPHGELPGVRLSSLHRDSTPEVIIDLITQVLGDELRYEGREVSLDGESRLLVLAPPPVQARVRSALAALEGALAAFITLRVDILTMQGDIEAAWPAQSLLAEEEVDRTIDTLLGRGASHQSYEFEAAAGRTSGIDTNRMLPLVFDYDVEIAQGAVVFDPVMLTAEEGTRILLRAAPTPGGVLISCVLIDAQALGDVRSVPATLRGQVGREQGGYTLVEGPEVLQSVDVLFRSVALDTFIPRGRAVLFATRSELAGSPKSGQLVVLRRVGGILDSYYSSQVADSTRRLALVNTELFSPPRLSVAGGHDLSAFAISQPYVVATLHSEPSLFLFDWMKYRFSVWRRLGPWAMAVTDPAWDGDSAGQLERLVGRWRTDERLVELELRLHAGDAVPVRCSVPLRPGSSCGVVVGVTTLVLHDYDVEVAQFAAVVDPLRTAVLNGLAVGISPSIGSDGELTITLDGSAHLLAGPIQPLALSGPLLGAIDEVVVDRLTLSDRLRFGAPRRPQSRSIGTAAAGDRRALRLEVIAR